MTLLVQLLSNQLAVFAGVSKEWRNGWENLPRLTQAITADTSVSQLQWSFDSGLRNRPMLGIHIAEHCGVDCLKCAHSNGCGLPNGACFNTPVKGNLETIQWALGDNRFWRQLFCEAAAAGGSLYFLQWAQAKDCPWDNTYSAAAGSSHVEILQWTRSEGCPWDGRTCAKAAVGEHLAVLKWAHVNGCPWSSTTGSEAAGTGRLDILQWARSENCP